MPDLIDNSGRSTSLAFPARRRFVTGLCAVAALSALGVPVAAARAAATAQGAPVLRGTQFDLRIGHQRVNFTGKERMATTINGSLPGPTLRWREGDRVTLRVHNALHHDSSIHWHGMILPSEMDGVPGMSFDGIRPGEIFEYAFDVNQNGTYWYHSHSGYQEQTGVYGAIVIEPRAADPVAYDREHVIVLSDWSDEAPEAIYATLKKASHYYNVSERTANDLLREIRDKGVVQTWRDREMWNQMRMSDRDIADVTGATYTFLMNGATPANGWRGLFAPGERVRLRFINAAAMTIFDVRIPGLEMRVVAADGQNIDPVTVDDFRIGVAETYDVIVEPHADSAYCVFAQSIDRSGFARGTLATHEELDAPAPVLDPRPILTHRDMGMAHGDHSMDHSQHIVSGPEKASMSSMDHTAHADMRGMDHSALMPTTPTLGKAGFGSTAAIVHDANEFGPHVDMRAELPQSGLKDPGIGLREHLSRYSRRVLTYADLRNLDRTVDRREPTRELQLHLTGNMSRYMWSFSGLKFADAEPLVLRYGERVRITLVNDTMMIHPIHLHGLWSELETGDPDYIPRKHTVIVQPGAKISYLVTADAYGRWAYHCHLLYHMPGMMREVRVA
ncbi:MAG: copper resistance system multicopper oxidase [Gammaproteobacteria bacterium]|nr:copper resistance system multicopper oxidase [Gammaproteobacteria bacterium]